MTFPKDQNQDQKKGQDHGSKEQTKQLRDKIKAQWPKLTDEDLAAVETDRSRLGEFIQQRHGVQPAAADTQVNDFRKRNQTLWPVDKAE